MVTGTCGGKRRRRRLQRLRERLQKQRRRSQHCGATAGCECGREPQGGGHSGGPKSRATSAHQFWGPNKWNQSIRSDTGIDTPRDATRQRCCDATVRALARRAAFQRGQRRRHAARAAAHRLQGRPRMEGCASPPQTREPPADAERSALPSVWLRSDGCTLWEAGCDVRLRLSAGTVPRVTRPSRTPAWRHAALAASRVQRALPVADRVV